MKKEKNKKTALIALAEIMIASVFTVNAVSAQNLLTNPAAQKPVICPAGRLLQVAVMDGEYGE